MRERSADREGSRFWNCGAEATILELVTRRRMILRFLIARMLYQDGVNGLLILGGTFAAGMFGWATLEIGLFVS